MTGESRYPLVCKGHRVLLDVNEKTKYGEKVLKIDYQLATMDPFEGFLVRRKCSTWITWYPSLGKSKEGLTRTPFFKNQVDNSFLIRSKFDRAKTGQIKDPMSWCPSGSDRAVLDEMHTFSSVVPSATRPNRFQASAGFSVFSWNPETTNIWYTVQMGRGIGSLKPSPQVLKMFRSKRSSVSWLTCHCHDHRQWNVAEWGISQMIESTTRTGSRV